MPTQNAFSEYTILYLNSRSENPEQVNTSYET